MVSMRWFPDDFRLPIYAEALRSGDNAVFDTAARQLYFMHQSQTIPEAMYGPIQDAIDENVVKFADDLYVFDLGPMAVLGSRTALKLLAERPITPGATHDAEMCRAWFNKVTGLDLTRKEQKRWIQDHWDNLDYDRTRGRFRIRSPESDRAPNRK